MKLFTNRRRPYTFGPYPLEKVPRADAVPPTGTPPLPRAPRERSQMERGEAPAPAPHSVAASIAPYLAFLRELRDGDTAPLPGGLYFTPGQLSDNLKGSAYFLDAAMVGICPLSSEHYGGRNSGDGAGGGAGGASPLEGHRWAVVMLIEEGLGAEPGGPGDAWLKDSETARGILRGGEIACTLAGYIRRLGYFARAHFGTDSGVDLAPLIVAAGLGRWNGAGTAVVNPFLEEAYHACAVTTSMELAPDRPLSPVSGDGALRFRHPAHFLGLWGGKPGWKRLSGDHRPAHLGRFPLEKLKRRETPTTYISENVPRVPIRGSFFNRAIFGDLGDKAKAERGRFALKHPFAAAMAPVFMAFVPHQDGEVAPAPPPGTEDFRKNALDVKAACHFLDADVVGICRVPEYAWYSHDEDGQPVDADHEYAIVILIDQGFETMEGASGDDWISGAQSMRAYMRGAEITGVVARHIRGLGYSARAHTNRLSGVLHIPLILQAGLGELSRIGELVLNPFVGPRFKSAVVTTNMPLEVDRPIDFGLQDFCEKCLKCARECPCNAISMRSKVMFNGYEIWKPDAEKCARYRLTNLKGSACGRCMKMCPYNTEGLLKHRFWLWVAQMPFTRRFLARLDDWLGHGRRNTVKRWWLDLEVVDGKVVKPKGVNERGLRNDFPVVPEKQKLALYPADLQPPPDFSEAWPVDRAEGLQRGRTAEKPSPMR